VARDPETGQLGVAVQSHYFSVGPIVPWAEAGVGAVATQSFADAGYGPRGLARMRAGQPAPQVLEALLAADPQCERRQVAMVDARARVGVHTGSLCIAEAGAVAGDGFSVQANMMRRASVWPAMANAFRAAQGELALRLLAALDAAEAEGGDIRGRQSAAILVVGPEPSDEPWNARAYELRVEDHPEPLVELRRLVEMRRLYAALNRPGLDWVAARKVLATASALAPENGEPRFWTAIAAANLGEIARARELLDGIPCADDRWRELARRLVPLGMLSAQAAGALGL